MFPTLEPEQTFVSASTEVGTEAMTLLDFLGLEYKSSRRSIWILCSLSPYTWKLDHMGRPHVGVSTSSQHQLPNMREQPSGNSSPQL